MNSTVTKIYESKTAGIIKKVPRSHLILLSVIEEVFTQEGIGLIEESRLLTEYNKRATKMMIDKVRQADLIDIVETLSNFSILHR